MRQTECGTKKAKISLGSKEGRVNNKRKPKDNMALGPAKIGAAMTFSTPLVHSSSSAPRLSSQTAATLGV